MLTNLLLLLLLLRAADQLTWVAVESGVAVAVACCVLEEVGTVDDTDAQTRTTGEVVGLRLVCEQHAADATSVTCGSPSLSSLSLSQSKRLVVVE